MNEEVKRRGRPAKTHLEEHHYKPASEEIETSDDAQAAGAPPASAESDQADAIELAPSVQSASAEPIVDPIVENSIIDLRESPIEQKIHQLVDTASLNGWHPIDTEIVIEMPPRNGMPVILSETTVSYGVLAMWKKTRKFANTTHRWQESGKWIDFHNGMDINFIPKYWKERF